MNVDINVDNSLILYTDFLTKILFSIAIQILKYNEVIILKALTELLIRSSSNHSSNTRRFVPYFKYPIL